MTSAVKDVVAREVRFVDALGVRLAYRRQGVGPSVVCLHATGHGARDFDRFAAHMAEGFDVIALDWPGQGESGADAEPASAGRYAALLEAAADALGLQRFILIGNSIGGAAAIRYAAAHPERVRGAVLCDPGGLQPVNWIARAVCGFYATKFEQGAAGDPRFGAWFRRYYERSVLRGAESAWRREEIIAGGYGAAPVLAEAWRSFAQSDADIRALTPKLAMPVLYAWARHDALVAWGRSAQAAKRAPHYELALFDAAHAAFLEQPDAFEARFRAFAARLPV